MKPKITVARTSNNAALQERLKELGKLAVYVGIPASSASDRDSLLQSLAGNATGKRQKKLTQALLSNEVSNAELLYIHSKGSELRNIPPRPVIEPAIQAPGNKEAIAAELGESAKATLDGRRSEIVTHLQRAGIAGQNASRDWFTDARNDWAPNAQSTIDRKGSDRPLIDTGALRAAITYVVEDDK